MENQSDSWINGYALPAGSDFNEFNRDDAEKVDFDVPTEVDIDSFSQSLHLSYAFDSVTLTSTTTHKKQDMEGDYDVDYQADTVYDGLRQFNYNETDAYTQELRVSSNNESGIRWIAGLYLDSEEYKQNPLGMQYPSYDGLGSFNGNFDYKAESEIDSTTYAAFGQAMVPIGERFELTLGSRYQHIDKEIDVDIYVLPMGTTGSPSSSFSGDKDWDAFLPKVALSYALSNNWHTYRFHQDDFQGDLTYNGSVLGTNFLPFFGYDRSRELYENKERLRQGLNLLDSRMDQEDNLFSRANRFNSLQSDSLSWNIVISTDGDQTVIGPEERVNAWQEKGRNYAQFRSEYPGSMDFKIISARLLTKAFNCHGVPCRLSHDPRHTYNLQVVEDAMQRVISWLSGKLGPYPYSVAQVVEKPLYDEDFITFANVTAISEAHGWTADIQKDEDGQYVYLTMAREFARQWILSSLKAADVQGAELLTQSIAQYYAFRFMDETWGPGYTGKWLDKACEDYRKERAEEAIEEKPLLFVDKADYLSKEKGGLALYAFSRRMGQEIFDRWLSKWIARAIQKETFLTSSDFYNDLKHFVPSVLHPFVRDWFEQRIQYRLSMDNAQIKDGKLTLTISAAKLESGGKKGTMEKNFSDPLGVGMADEAGIVKDVRQIMIRPGQNSYVLDCRLSSATIILDPNYWYLIEARKKCSKKL